MFSKIYLIIGFFIFLNLSAFLLMLLDKNISKKKGNRSRISEGMLFFMATIFSSFGVYLGMFIFRHKTKKWYFVIGIPLLMLQNISFLYLVYKTFFSLEI